MGLKASTDVGPVRFTVAGAPQRRPRRPLRSSRERPAATLGGVRMPMTTVRMPGSVVALPPPTAPAGWYPDPAPGAGTRVRWWTGVKWTRRTAAEAPSGGEAGPARPEAPGPAALDTAPQNVVRTRSAARPPGLRKPVAPAKAAPLREDGPRRDPTAAVRRYRAAFRGRSRRARGA